MQKNIVQLKAEGTCIRKDAEFCFDMADFYAPSLMSGEGERTLRLAREAEAAFRKRRDELYEKWGRFVR